MTDQYNEHNRMTDQTIILDTPDQLAMFRLLQVKYALRIEVRTGMTHSRGSMLKVANGIFRDHDLPAKRTKAAALAQMETLIDGITRRMAEAEQAKIDDAIDDGYEGPDAVLKVND